MSDEEEQYNAKSHKNLLQAINSLGKAQHIRKVTRSEPQRQQDEFQLLKRTSAASATAAEITDALHPVGINDIVKILRTTKKHLDTGKKLKTVQSTKKVLEKPLEKPAAERIKRNLGYENVKAKLERWDAVVTKNRAAETQVFPLKTGTIYVDTSVHARRPPQRELKSDIMCEMEKVEAHLKELKRKRMGDTVDEKELAKREEELLKKKLTREELIARRNELTYLKVRESQKSAKARMRNKIKSKKYHKLLKRQKLQEQIKEFELLQKSDPEAALEKLNALEKGRVLERASLRHKNTGTWAKNLQIRAKYDKDVRKDLAEQLEVSRQLTARKENHDSDEEVDETNAEAQKPLELEAEVANDPLNPWTKVGTTKKSEENVDKEEGENWRKYWLERNVNEKLLEQYKKELEKSEENCDDNDDGNNVGMVVEDEEQENDDESAEDIAVEVQSKKLKPIKSQKKRAEVEKKSSTKAKKNPQIENGWVVEEIGKTAPPAKKSKNKKTKSIDDIFDAQEDKNNRRLSKTLKLLKQQSKKLEKSMLKTKKPKVEKDALKNLKDLSFKSEKTRPEIDEELNNDELNDKDTMLTALNETLGKEATTTKTSSGADHQATTIDPTKVAEVKLKQHLNNTLTAINDTIGDVDMDEIDENDRFTEQQMTISQAFEDDDIIADFSKDKTKESTLKDTEIELSMPGWGSWAGAGISKEQSAARRNKRLVLNLVQEEKRRDENKNGVYINETANKQLRTHLVSDIPFPFKSLADYEASIRAPIGRNFVPETAFRMLTRPAVITLKGQIIEPMDETELVKRDRKLRNIVDRRIQRATKEAKAAVAKGK